jgi:hypothetical protein
MIREDQVFIVDVVVTDPTREMVASNVISQPIGAVVEPCTIVKIHKYKRLHEGHRFIPMTMEVYGAPEHDMDRFIRECAHLFHDRQSRGHLSLSFYIQFFKQHVNIAFQRALASAIENKIMLTVDVCSRPLIIIKYHNLHVGDIRRVMGEIVSYHDKD